MYDDTLTKVCIKTMYAAPVFGLMLASWAYSNQQVFANFAPALDKNWVYPLCNHTFDQFFYQLTPGTPLFIGLICAIISCVFQNWLRILSGKFFNRPEADKVSKMKIVELLPPFSEAMKTYQKKMFVKE